MLICVAVGDWRVSVAISVCAGQPPEAQEPERGKGGSSLSPVTALSLSLMVILTLTLSFHLFFHLSLLSAACCYQ